MPPKTTVLIADDDRVVVTLMSEYLRKQGYNVAVAFDAMQAWMGVRNAAPKVVVVDINMPGGNGIDVIRKIKSNTKTTQVAVIVITGSLDPVLADEARELGAEEFLTKPVKPEDLHGAIRRALGGSPPTGAGSQ